MDNMARATIQALYKDSQLGFRMDLAVILEETKVFGQALEGAIGEISREEALTALQAFVVERIVGRK